MAHSLFEIVAHRGFPDEAPENTLASFQRAVDLGVDAVELDVRLTADHVPVVFHNFYLDGVTSAAGPIFNYTFDQLRDVQVFCQANPAVPPGRISTLQETLEQFSGRVGLEIEVKGPEPEAAELVGRVLNDFRADWDRYEVTSCQTVLLLAIGAVCPGLAVNLLFQRSENWMKPDVAAYQAAHLARQARARAVHLHPTQLSAEVAAFVRQQGFEIHAWEVNDEAALIQAVGLRIPRICTDRYLQAASFRSGLALS